MKNVKIIGITGGIGSGKSIVCKVFALLGVPIYESDSKAKYLMNNDDYLIKTLKKTFGNEIYNDKKELNRTFIIENVLIDNQKTLLLNSIVHPKVAQDFIDWQNKHQNYDYLLNESALLFESGSYKRMNKVITVFAPLEIRKKRINSRDKQRTEQEIDNIIKKQLPEEEKKERADFTIENDDKKALLPQILQLHYLFRHLK